MRKSSQFEYGVLEVKTQCFRGFQPRHTSYNEEGYFLVLKWYHGVTMENS